MKATSSPMKRGEGSAAQPSSSSAAPLLRNNGTTLFKEGVSTGVGFDRDKRAHTQFRNYTCSA